MTAGRVLGDVSHQGEYRYAFPNRTNRTSHSISIMATERGGLAMEDNRTGVEPDSVAALAALLSAVAQGADGVQAARYWDSLVSLVGRPAAHAPTSELAGIPELTALRRNPHASERAESLARSLLTRARDDAEFRRALSNWRRRKGIQTLARTDERAVNAGSAHQPSESPTASKPWYRRMPVWVGPAVVGPVIAGTVLLFETGLAGRIFDNQPTISAPAARTSSATGVSSPPPAGSTLPATAPNSPARVETVTPLNTEPEETYAAANKIQFAAGQLAQLNADFRSGGTSSATANFFSSVHAVPVGAAFTNVTVIGNAKTTVTISSLQIVKNCQAPLTGTLFLSPSQGVNGTIGLGFDLDSPIYYARKSDYGFHGGDFFKDNVVTLAPGEAQTFDINVQTFLHYCQFTFQMTVATPNGAIIENINDNGRPFELTAEVSRGYAAEYIGGIEASLTPSLHDPQGNWVPVDPKTFQAG